MFLPPPGKKGNALQDQIAHDELYRVEGVGEGVTALAVVPFRQKASNKVLLTRNTQTANR